MEHGPVAIRYTLRFELEQARIEEGLTAAEFDALPGTPQWTTAAQPYSKAHALMRYRLAHRIPAVVQDAQKRDLDRQRALNQHRRR